MWLSQGLQSCAFLRTFSADRPPLLHGRVASGGQNPIGPGSCKNHVETLAGRVDSRLASLLRCCSCSVGLASGVFRARQMHASGPQPCTWHPCLLALPPSQHQRSRSFTLKDDGILDLGPCDVGRADGRATPDQSRRFHSGSARRSFRPELAGRRFHPTAQRKIGSADCWIQRYRHAAAIASS